jgi:hypothetical protein
MRNLFRPSLALLAGGLLTACVSMPTGPSVMVLPGSSVGFDQFRADDAMCRSWAGQQVGAGPAEGANRNTAAGAAAGTALGAAAGAAMGAAAGNPAAGAAAGAGGGLLLGSASGAARGDWAASELQQRYDQAYMQCMYAKGNQIPVWGAAPRQSTAPSASPRLAPPAPPAGPPPPPPPDVS